MSATVIDLETARLRRWEKKQQAQFRHVVTEDLNWVCKCGCWQFEAKQYGIICLGCRTKQEIVINPIMN